MKYTPTRAPEDFLYGTFHLICINRLDINKYIFMILTLKQHMLTGE